MLVLFKLLSQEGYLPLVHLLIIQEPVERCFDLVELVVHLSVDRRVSYPEIGHPLDIVDLASDFVGFDDLIITARARYIMHQFVGVARCSAVSTRLRRDFLGLHIVLLDHILDEFRP